MTNEDTQIRYSVSRNYASQDFEIEEDAIYFEFENSRYEGPWRESYAGISPTEAREIAAALNREADAFDAREKARQDAKKYPQEDGWYLIGGTPRYLSGGDWYTTQRGWPISSVSMKLDIDDHGYKKMTVED